MKSCARQITLFAFLSVCVSLSQAQTASQVLTLTGNKNVKIVWSRYVSGNIDNMTLFGSDIYRLMTYSTTTDQVTDVLNTTGAFYRAKITHDGSKIIYNNGHDLWMVDWSGSNNHLVMKGAGICCYWYDPTSGKDYAFVARGSQTMASWTDSDPIYRVCLSDTTDKLLIQVTSNGYAGIWLAVSNDGTRLGGHFPWTSGAGGGGIYTLAANGTGTFKSFNVYGCWGMTPPDDSYRFLLYDVDTHNEWAVFNADGSGKHIINIVPTGLPASGPQCTYNARMLVDDPHFFTLVAPLQMDANGFTQSVGIYLGKVDDSITAVQGWVKIAGSGECLGCSWIDESGITPTQPALSSSTTQLAFNATFGGSNPAAQTVTITNSGSGTLSAVTATSDTGWLTVTGGSAGNTQTLSNQVNIANLAIGTHTANVTVKGGGAANTVTYKAVLTISADAPHLASIVITPPLDSIGTGARAFFTVRCKDQRNNPITTVVNWSASGGGTLSRTTSPKADSTDTSSFLSGGSLGTFLVIASSGQVKDTATVIVTAALVYSIKLLSPLGDKSYSVGDTMRVQWTASANIPSVVIHLSVDDGLNWAGIRIDTTGTFGRTDPRWGNVAWKIPATIPMLQAGGTMQNISTVSNSVLVEVRGYFNEASDVSPNAFAIRQASGTASPYKSAAASIRFPEIQTIGERQIVVTTGGAARIQIHDLQGRCWADRACSDQGAAFIQLPHSGIYLVRIFQSGRLVITRLNLSE